MPENMELQEGRGGEITCIHTKKIFDSCQSKDCLEDLHFFPTKTCQGSLENASAVRSGRAELLDVVLNVSPVGLGRGFYEVSLNFYYRAVLELSTGGARPVAADGLLWFNKRCVLFGSEGGAKLFSSVGPAMVEGSVPTAVCEAVDPIVLSTRLVDLAVAPEGEVLPGDLPESVRAVFDDELVITNEPGKRVYVTLGQFSILRLEREAQLLMSVYDYCMPEKECECSEPKEDPCELFQSVEFPVADFFPHPPKK